MGGIHVRCGGFPTESLGPAAAPAQVQASHLQVRVSAVEHTYEAEQGGNSDSCHVPGSPRSDDTPEKGGKNREATGATARERLEGRLGSGLGLGSTRSGPPELPLATGRGVDQGDQQAESSSDTVGNELAFRS